MVYVSDAAHYSNMRLVDLQNLDLVLVPADIHGCMIPEELEKALIPDRPALMVYAMVNRKVQPFDSIAISGHKFFGMDEPAGLFLTTMEVKNNQNPYEVAYLNGSMPMINCSRSAIAPLKFWWIIMHTGLEGFTEQATGMLETAAWLKAELDKLNWPAWLEPMSNTVYFKRPPEDIMVKYALAPDVDERLGGELAHIVVMQHVKKDHLQLFLDDLKQAQE